MHPREVAAAQTDLILSVLRELPLRPERQSDDCLHDAALSLMYMQSFGAFLDNPGSRFAGTKAAAEGLDKLGDDIVRMTQSLFNLPREALNALDAHSPHPGGCYDVELFDQMFKVQMVIAHAQDDIAAQPHKPAPRGRRPKRCAEYVGYKAMQIYEDLTGRRATITSKEGEGATGPYLEFLDRLLETIGVDAKAEAVARKARAWQATCDRLDEARSMELNVV